MTKKVQRTAISSPHSGIGKIESLSFVMIVRILVYLFSVRKISPLSQYKDKSQWLACLFAST